MSGDLAVALALVGLAASKAPAISTASTLTSPPELPLCSTLAGETVSGLWCQVLNGSRIAGQKGCGYFQGNGRDGCGQSISCIWAQLGAARLVCSFSLLTLILSCVRHNVNYFPGGLSRAHGDSDALVIPFVWVGIIPEGSFITFIPVVTFSSRSCYSPSEFFNSFQFSQLT